MKKYLLVSLISFLGICVSQDSFAGARITQEVFINTSTRYASGSLGSARSSVDSTQYIQCELTVTSGGATTVINCTAVNSANTSAYCSKTNPAASLISAVTSIGPSSYVNFTWDVANTCSSIIVINSSRNKPMIP